MANQDEGTPSNADIESTYDAHLMPTWKALDVPVRRAEGCTLEDFDGNEYLDVFSGISVTGVGHRNERVVEAAKSQLDELVHGCTYIHPNRPAAALAETIASVAPGDLEKSFFCNSGTEAVEGAIKLARKYTGHTEIVALEMAFHGRTLGSLALTGNHAYKHGMAPTINDVVHAPPPYRYRSPFEADSDDAFADQAAAAVERTIETATAEDVAAVVVEPVLGEGGIIVPPDGWLSRLEEIAHDHGALLVVDEVQTGYGRTGSFWAVDHVDVQPDILLQAKGIANGFPLGAFTASAEVADSFEAGDHFSTFGGNPVACAAARATIEELQGGIVENAREQGTWLGDALEELASRHDVVGEARGLGLMWGVEVVDPEETGPFGAAPAPDAALAKRLSSHLHDRGIIVGVGGFYGNVLRFQPPLTIGRADLERTVTALRAALDEEAA